MRASIRGGCFASFEGLLQFLSQKSFKRDGQQEEKMEMSDERGKQKRYVLALILVLPAGKQSLTAREGEREKVARSE